MRFSQRIGKTPVKDKLQIENIDSDLRNQLWNVILENFFYKLEDNYDFYYSKETDRGMACKLVWKNFFKYPIDTIHVIDKNNLVYSVGVIEYIRKYFFSVSGTTFMTLLNLFQI